MALRRIFPVSVLAAMLPVLALPPVLATVPVQATAASVPVVAQFQMVAQAVPVVPTPAGLATLQDDSYLLGPGDGLDLKLFDAPEFSGALEVLNDGTVSLPLIGSVRLTGLSLSQVNLWLTSLYRKQLLRPELQLRVVKPRPIRVALVGEVERPGLYSLTTSGGHHPAGRPAPGGAAAPAAGRSAHLQTGAPESAGPGARGRPAAESLPV
jgi:polysaccharide export outer membrane protein